MTLTGHIVGTKGNTGRGIASIVENADYTITINLTDGTSYTTAPIAGFTAVEFDENYDLVVTKTDGTTVTVETDLDDYRTVLNGYKNDAAGSATNASNSATAASGSASTASAQATLARSYAKGDTSSRTGEDTDNADYYRGLAAASATAAGTSESNAGAQALKSEGYAVGKQNGTDVSSGSDYYHNNAKYYSDMAHIDATDASSSQSSASGSASTASAKALVSEGYAVGKQNGEDVSSGSDYYHNNSKYYKEQAASSATGASGSASSASASALVAEGWAKGTQNGTAVEIGTYFEDNAKYYAEEAASSASDAAASAASLTVDSALSGSSTNPVQNKVIKGELDKKANIDGYYESLGSGTADQLASNIYEENNTPYNFRTSGGSIDIGDRETDMLVGGSVVWNQLQQKLTDPNGSVSGVTATIDSDGYLVLSGTATEDGQLQPVPQRSSVPANHVLLYMADGTPDYMWGRGGFGLSNTGKYFIHKYSLAFSAVVFIQLESGHSYNSKTRFNIIDLTQMFGSTIADYIYSLEQANAGAGVAFFRKLFPKPYYAYNAGELMSVNASSHDMVGFNAWDEVTESGYINITDGSLVNSTTYSRSKNYIPVLPGTNYYAKMSTSQIAFACCWYDASHNYLTFSGEGSTKNKVFQSPANAHYMKFYMDKNYYNNDVCINLSWDGERDGEYEAYVKHSYPLDSSLTLRGIPKLDNGKLYYDGDTYESDGTVTRKYGVVDLGTLDWIYQADYQGYPIFYSLSLRNVIKIPLSMAEQANILCEKYIATTRADGISDKNLIFINTGGELDIRDTAYSDATTFKNSLSGVYLVYEKATPTTETADTYTNLQIVNDFGTEEYVDYAVSQGDRDVSIPVGHYTQYMANLKAKLEMSPNSPEGAGDYIVRQTNGENEYVTLASNATIQDIIARLEALEGGE